MGSKRSDRLFESSRGSIRSLQNLVSPLLRASEVPRTSGFFGRTFSVAVLACSDDDGHGLGDLLGARGFTGSTAIGERRATLDRVAAMWDRRCASPGPLGSG